MFSSRRLIIFALAYPIAFAAHTPSAKARPRGDMALASSVEDAALRARLAGLSPSVNPDEARRVAYTAYTTGQELARNWRMVSPAVVQNFLIKVGVRKSGYCFQWAGELLIRLAALKLKTLELHWAESDPGGDEHNVIVVTARDQPFARGILLDNWRYSGRLLWGPVTGDPGYPWKENREELTRRLKRGAFAPDRPQRTTSSKRERQPR
jgi:hypothetical protein